MQAFTPPNVYVDCECGTPVPRYGVWRSSSDIMDDTDEGSKSEEPLNPVRPCCKSALELSQVLSSIR